MVRKKKTTARPVHGQPIRFYKFVALSFLCITILLLGLIVFMSAKRATITITTKPEPIDTNFTLEVGDEQNDSILTEIKSTVVELEKRYEQHGVREEEGQATGYITIYNDNTAPQPLVVKTRFLTPDNVLFRLKSGVTVPAGGTVQAEVYADEKGAAGNIGPSDFVVPGLKGKLHELVYAKSTEPMAGGVRYIGVLSQKDLTAATDAFLEELKTLGEKTLQADQKGLVGTYKVVQHVADADAEIGAETDGFTLSGKATVVGVFYEEDQLKNYATSVLEKQLIHTSEAVQTGVSVPNVVIDSFDLESNKASLDVAYTGLVVLDSNSKELQKLMFYGKTEDEVRRYVLSLDHVQGVDLNFRPLWNKSVPHVADHVEIIVRQVE